MEKPVETPVEPSGETPQEPQAEPPAALTPAPVETIPPSGGKRSRAPLVIALVVVLLAALGAGGYFGYRAYVRSNVQSQEADLVQAARDALANNNPAAAETAANQALALTPAEYLLLSQSAVALRGQALALQEEYTAALPDLEAALQTDSQNAVLLALRGKAYLKTGEILKALDDFAASLKLDASQPDLLRLQALTAFDLGDLALARSAAEAAGELDPTFALPYAFQAEDSYLRHAYTDTLRLANQAIELRNPPAFAYRLRGAASYWLYDLASARADLEQALALDPHDIEATALLALLSAETDQVDDLNAAAEVASLQARKTAAGLLAQAAAALYAYDYTQARLLLDEALLLAPERPEIYILHSWTYTASLDEAARFAEVETAASLAPHNRLVRSEQAALAIYMYDLDGAQAIGEELVSAYPAGMDGYDILNSVYNHRYELRRALEIAEQGLAAAGENATLYNARGDSYQLMGENDKARLDFEHALALRPTGTYALISLAVLANDTGDEALALERIQQVLDLDPDHIYAYLLRASIYADQGKDDLAKADRKAALAIDESDRNVIMDLVDQDQDKEDYFSAKSKLSKLADRYPLWSSVKVNQAGIFFFQDDLTEARKLLDEVLDVIPNHTDARLLRGYIEVSRGNFDLAQDEVDQILTVQPRSAYAHALQGNIYFYQGMVQEAEASFRKALEIDPERYDDHFTLGMLHFQSGDYAQAITDFQSALQGGENPTASLLLKTLQDLPSGYKPYFFAEPGFVISVPADAGPRAGEPGSNLIVEFIYESGDQFYIIKVWQYSSVFSGIDFGSSPGNIGVYLFSGFFHQSILDNNPSFREGELVDFEALNVSGAMNPYTITINGYPVGGNMYFFIGGGYIYEIEAFTLSGMFKTYTETFDTVAASFGVLE